MREVVPDQFCDLFKNNFLGEYATIIVIYANLKPHYVMHVFNTVNAPIFMHAAHVQC